MPALFDVYVAVDWSARGKPSPQRPSKDSVWVSETTSPEFAGPDAPQERYFCTRGACEAYLRGRLANYAEAGRRVFLGFDFAYGYPRGYARALGLEGSAAPWRRVWDELARMIVDQDNVNNRFEAAARLNARCGGASPGPLWGCPLPNERPTLKMTSPAYPYPVDQGHALPRLRLTDEEQRGVQPVWKLYGNGSVGSQVLVGIPVVTRLRDDPLLAAFSRVWPFETGFTPAPTPAEGPFIVHTEIWPGITKELDPRVPIRDQAQVRAVTGLLARLDADGALGGLFDRPGRLFGNDEARVVAEEGWILGAGLSFT